jgi:hypothetical protein
MTSSTSTPSSEDQEGFDPLMQKENNELLGHYGPSDDHHDGEVENNNVKSNNKSRSKRQDKDKNEVDSRKKYSTYKYSSKGRDDLHEAVILSGLPVFLKSNNSKIGTTGQIEELGRIIRPPNIEEYPYEPYEFANIGEVEFYIERTKSESANVKMIDSLFQMAKSIVGKYNDQDDHVIVLLAADLVWSYFQDRFSTTHYVGVIGDNGSGKSTIGDTFEAVGYRAVNMTDPTASNIFRVLGMVEYGQCTIIVDEAEKIDKSSDIMSVLKTGYDIKKRVARMNMSIETIQQFFYTYCFKIIIAERSPNQHDAKGVLDRTFVFTSYKGKPQYDIKEVLNPAGDEGRKKLLDELTYFRKLMLVYRLIHFKDPILDIDTGLEGRDKELCKPLLQLFSNTKSYEEIRMALSKFLNIKNKRKGNLIEAALHPIIVNLISGNGGSREVLAANIWREIVGGAAIQGYFEDKKPNEYQTADYNTIYRNTITSIICDKFGAEKKHTEDGSLLVFDLDKLVKVGKAYGLETNIQTELSVFEEEQQRGHPDGPDGPDGSTGKQGHFKVEGDVRTVSNSSDSYEKSPDISTNIINPIIEKHSKQPNPSQEPSAPSEPSASSSITTSTGTNDADTISKSTYRLGHSDIFACNNCRLRGDKWFMQGHPCKGSRSSN